MARRPGRKPIVVLLADRAELDILDATDLGRLDRVRAILAQDPRQADGPGRHGIPLRAAAHRGHLEIVEALLRAGAHPTLSAPPSTPR